MLAMDEKIHYKKGSTHQKAVRRQFKRVSVVGKNSGLNRSRPESRGFLGMLSKIQLGFLRRIWAHEISFFVRHPELG